jgi:hypothetical protein
MRTQKRDEPQSSLFEQAADATGICVGKPASRVRHPHMDVLWGLKCAVGCVLYSQSLKFRWRGLMDVLTVYIKTVRRSVHVMNDDGELEILNYDVGSAAGCLIERFNRQLTPLDIRKTSRITKVDNTIGNKFQYPSADFEICSLEKLECCSDLDIPVFTDGVLNLALALLDLRKAVVREDFGDEYGLPAIEIEVDGKPLDVRNREGLASLLELNRQ